MRNLRLFEFVERLFKKEPRSTPRIEDSWVFGTLDWDAWMVEADRAVIEDDITTIINNCPLVSTALEIVVETATSFDEPRIATPILIEGSKRFHAIVDPLIERTGLMSLIPQIAYNTLAYGNTFLSIVYDTQLDTVPGDGNGSNKIIALKQILPPKTVQRRQDEFGNLDSEKAFIQVINGREVAYWSPMEMHHFRFPYYGGKYGSPQLKQITKLWSGFRLLRNQLYAMRAQVGPGVRVHKVPVPYTAPDERVKYLLERYKDRIGAKNSVTISNADNVVSVMRGKTPTDIFLPVHYTPDGKVIEADIKWVNQVQDTFDRDEMIFWINHIVTRLRVPPKMLFWDLAQARIAEAGTDPEEQGLVRFATALAREVAAGVKRIIDIELILNGVNPQEEPYRVVVPTRHTTSALSRARAAALIAQSVLMSSQVGINPEWWLRNVVGIEVEGLDNNMIEPAESNQALNGLHVDLRGSDLRELLETI